MQKGQSVVAYVKVPYDDEMCWILANLIESEAADGMCVVEDIVEEHPNMKRESYRVDSKYVVKFPQRGAEYKAGDRVLAVWYETNTQNWTSILYPATVLQAYPSTNIPNSVVVKLRYDGDPKISYINALWVIAAPEL